MLAKFYICEQHTVRFATISLGSSGRNLQIQKGQLVEIPPQNIGRTEHLFLNILWQENGEDYE